ncbi:MAG TPA: hypothetical protein VHJ20_01460 [Polyangia bacterium]|nr:hypothetical protein [Polyangia bacterium]
MSSMAETQGATPPPWLGRSRLRLFFDAVGGLRANVAKVVQLFGLVLGYLRPAQVRARFERLRALGYVDVVPTWAQALVAGRDQMMLGASEETKLFYKSQGIPWIFHNARRFLAGPATMLDPIGLFSPKEAIAEHVLQTFHRHPVYDLVLLSAQEGGLDEMKRQAAAFAAGKHPNQRALASLVEDGAYHARLPRELAAFEADPHAPARPIPPDLVADPYLMLAMDQFKDIGGYARYAARLDVGVPRAILAWLGAGFDEAVGSLLGLRLGPTRIRVEACDPDIVERHVARHVPPAATAASGR